MSMRLDVARIARTQDPEPVLAVFRGVGQVFFQENALTGALLLAGDRRQLAADGGRRGRRGGDRHGDSMGLKFDQAEVAAGIYGFNSTLVGIATLFFFRPGLASVAAPDRRLRRGDARDLADAAVRAVPDLHRAVHRHDLGPLLPGAGLGAARVEPGGPTARVGFVGAVAHGVGQVMFQASIWTGLLFLAGIAVNDWRHASWVLLGSVVGMLLGSYHATAAMRPLDPESLVERALAENVASGCTATTRRWRRLPCSSGGGR